MIYHVCVFNVYFFVLTGRRWRKSAMLVVSGGGEAVVLVIVVVIRVSSLRHTPIFHWFRTKVHTEKLCIATILGNLLPHKYAYKLLRTKHLCTSNCIMIFSMRTFVITNILHM